MLPTTGQGGSPEIAGAAELGGAAGAAGAGTGGPECTGEQWPVEHCGGGCLRRFPDHCYDGKMSDDELDVDCGGSCQGCTSTPCSQASDCLSDNCAPSAVGPSSCHAPLTISFTSHELNSVVGIMAWSITLKNAEPDGEQSFKLRDVKLRYYITRSGIMEPLLLHGMQSNLTLASGPAHQLDATTWTIERVESTPDSAYDAYVEVGFDDSTQLFPGDKIDLYQQMLTGDPGTSSFDQRTNYSFTAQPDFPWLRVTVFDAGKLLWGLEPRPANPRSCFARGVNLDGPALVVDGHAFEGAADAAIVSTGTDVAQTGAPFPAVTGTLATLLQTSTQLQAGSELSLPVDNGIYLAYLYATSPSNDGTASVFTVQGAPPDVGSKFRAQAADGGQAWSKLGPFRVDVKDGKLTLGVTSGAVSFAGIELWYAD